MVKFSYIDEKTYVNNLRPISLIWLFKAKRNYSEYP